MGVAETSDRVDAAMARLEEQVRRLAEGISTTVSTMELIDVLFRRAPKPLIVGTMEAWLLVSEGFAAGLGYSAAELERRDWRSLLCSPSEAEETQMLLDEAGPVAGHVMAYRHKDGRCIPVLWHWSEADETGISIAMGEFLG